MLPEFRKIPKIQVVISIPQTSHWHHGYSVGSGVGIVADTCKDHQKRWSLHAIGVDGVAEFFECFGAVFYEGFTAQFNLYQTV